MKFPHPRATTARPAGQKARVVEQRIVAKLDMAAVVRHVDASQPPHALPEVVFRLGIIDCPPGPEGAETVAARIDHPRHVELRLGFAHRRGTPAAVAALALCQLQDTDRDEYEERYDERRSDRARPDRQPPGAAFAELAECHRVTIENRTVSDHDRDCRLHASRTRETPEHLPRPVTRTHARMKRETRQTVRTSLIVAILGLVPLLGLQPCRTIWPVT